MSTKEVMIDKSFVRQRNQEKIKRDEEEIEALFKAQQGGQKEEDEVETPEETGEEEQQIETQEIDTSSEEEELTEEEKTFKKRYGDIRRHFSKKEKEFAEKEKEFKKRIRELENGDSFSPPTSEKELEDWMGTYPEVANIVKSISMKQAEEMFKERFEEYDKVTDDVKRTKAEGKIREVHVDYDSLVANDDFHDWLEKQPEVLQNSIYENQTDHTSAIRVIDLYKLDKGITNKDKKDRSKEAAKDVSTKSIKPKLDEKLVVKKIKESDVDKMSEQEFEKNYEKILEAQREGNFIYDITN